MRRYPRFIVCLPSGLRYRTEYRRPAFVVSSSALVLLHAVAAWVEKLADQWEATAVYGPRSPPLSAPP